MMVDGRIAGGINGRHVLMGFIGFFGLIFLANGLFVYFALATFSGGDTSDPYRKGLNYNDTIAEAERQAEQGWRTELAYDAEAGQLRLSFRDKAAEPVSGLHLDATLSRPATAKEDRSVKLTEVSQGVYAGDVRLAPGAWVVSVESDDEGANQDYRLKQRLFVAERP